MSRSILSFVALGTLTLAACSPAEVVVTSEIEQADPAQGEDATRNVTLGNLEVTLIPFDRDQLFDSLAAAAPTPEPEIPPALLEAQEQIADAYAEWQALEGRWNTLRDTLNTLSREMEQYNTGEGRYVALYNQFQDLEVQYDRVDNRRQTAFQRFDSLTQANLAQSQEIKIQRQNWEDEVFADIGPAWDAYVRQSGRAVQTDTTSANGIVRFSGMKPGEWWVHARYEAPNAELYWNVPVTVERGEVVEVALTRANAEERPKL